MSCEVSALNICLITLDQFLVVQFPFSRVRFQRTSALLACMGAWAIGATISAIPFFKCWAFYSENGICIPLPLSPQTNNPGNQFAFGIMIIANLVLFAFVALGQSAIYRAVSANSLVTSGVDSRKQQNMNIARRLITVAVTDFLCWFPVSMIAILAKGGVAMPGGTNAALITFVIPLNSAFNPVLYTFSYLAEKRRRRREQSMLSFIKSLKPKPC